MTEKTTPTYPVVRRNEDSTLDEIVASNCTLHLEQLDAGQWWMSVEAGGVEYHVTLYTKRNTAILAQVNRQ